MSYSTSFKLSDNIGLSRFYYNVFWVMSIGLAITGVIALWISGNDGMMETLFHTYSYVEKGETKTGFNASGWWWMAAVAELALVLIISWGGVGKNLSVGACLLFFLAYSALNGVTLAPVMWSYTKASVVQVFFITAGMFAGSAFFGAVTKINMLPMRGFFLMSLIGLLIALVVSMFIHSRAVDIGISMIAVVLFAALTAFDMQKLRELYHESDGDVATLVVYGALVLYLDFVNMFLHLLRLFGVKKD